ncbi:TauD/TfdA family dioxygenase [Massilia sp. NR 4-1]|uniref:TauD/TfdA family dioxygenase n=1 Tax=Massilia sp. NR 4-1 TaxID=1678028 RepID=UPI00067B359E|nr:TauD/TfdA family dioxygenase [Massilia sp. NR 4-1]
MDSEIKDNLAWSAAQLSTDPAWVHTLTAGELAELNNALVRAMASGRPLEQLRTRDFPLHELAITLQGLAAELEEGRGVVRIDGLPVERYRESELRCLFWGLGQYLGSCVSQSDAGELIMNIKDAGGDPDDLEVRGVHSRGALQYHTDLCDVVGMLSVHAAAEGGESLLLNSLAVHDEIRRTRPDLLEVLYRPFCYAKPKWDAPGERLLEMRPIFAVHEGRFVSTYLRDFIDWAQEDERVPRLQPIQTEALDYLDTLCNDARFSYSFMLEPGQILFFNSFVTYHSRRAFRNHADPERHRNLLRLWLSMTNSRALPESYRSSYGEVAAGALRGGIHPGAGSGQRVTLPWMQEAPV